MSEWFRFGLCALLAACGIFVILTSVFGVFRFRFVLNRMQCAAIIDTLGVMFILAALMLAADAPIFIWKLLGVLGFIWIGSPLSSHLVARMELRTDKDALNHMEHTKETEKDPDGLL